jgi:hypothetical protein
VAGAFFAMTYSVFLSRQAFITAQTIVLGQVEFLKNSFIEVNGKAIGFGLECFTPTICIVSLVAGEMLRIG